MTKADKIKKLFDLECVQTFIDSARKSADEMEKILKSQKPEADKYLDLFETLVENGIADPRELDARS